MSRRVFGLVIVAGNAVQRRGQLAIWYWSDLGGKNLWYGNGSLTLFESGARYVCDHRGPVDHRCDARPGGGTAGIDDAAFGPVYSEPCAHPKKIAVYRGYLGVSSVQAVPCDHLALSSSQDDFQIWIDHTGKPLPRKIVINHRSEQGSPEYIAILSGWKFPKDIAASRFQPQLPKDAKQIAFKKAEEAKP